MKTIQIEKKIINPSDYIKRSALPSDGSIFINEDTKIVDDQGNTKILYYKLNFDTEKYVRACHNIDYTTTTRTSGLKTTSATFGYAPRNALRNDFCTSAAMVKNNPSEHSAIIELGQQISQAYRSELPDIFNLHEEMVTDKVKDSWRIPNTPFTSGIINKNNPLKYHFDSGNFENVYSNMIVFKNDVEGGHLACPEYDLVLDCANNYLVMFDGQSILHGVTPIKKTSERAFRYSIVYYSLKKMWECEPLTEEVARLRRVKQERLLKKFYSMEQNENINSST